MENIGIKWDTVYDRIKRESLGWYEKNANKSLELIEKYTLDKKYQIIDIGCGETTMIQDLANKGYKNIRGLDISKKAIKFLKNEIKVRDNEFKIKLEVQDITKKIKFKEKGKIWHDRAVFHFFHDECQIINYKENLETYLDLDGIFIISCFSQNNRAEYCNELKVKKYNPLELLNIFNEKFKLLESFNYEFFMPNGDSRDFLYCIFKKII